MYQSDLKVCVIIPQCVNGGRRRQNFTIFDPNPPPFFGIFFLLSVAKFEQFFDLFTPPTNCRRHKWMVPYLPIINIPLIFITDKNLSNLLYSIALMS